MRVVVIPIVTTLTSIFDAVTTGSPAIALTHVVATDHVAQQGPTDQAE